MDSEQKAENGAAADTGTGNQSSATSLIDTANTAAERLERAAKAAEEAAAKLQEQQAKAILGGRADAGVARKTPEQLKEEQEEAEAKAWVDRMFGAGKR